MLSLDEIRECEKGCLRRLPLIRACHCRVGRLEAMRNAKKERKFQFLNPEDPWPRLFSSFKAIYGNKSFFSPSVNRRAKMEFLEES